MKLMEMVSTPEDRPLVCTILGDAGVGKTSLAASLPKPIFIRAEDGLQAVSGSKRPQAFPKLKKVDDLWDQLNALITEDHDFRTLVVDSVTALERMFIAAVIESDPKKPRGIQQALGGYGAGRDAVLGMHARLRKAAEVLGERRGMHVVFIAHADTNRVEPPDDDSYMRYTLRLHEKSMAPYIDDVDLVGFLRLETYVRGEGEKKKAVSDGTRVLICHAMAACVSKNRFGISEPLVVQPAVNPLSKITGE